MSKLLKRLVFSPMLQKASTTKKIAYLGVMTALSVVCNTFLEIKFSDVQFSLTVFMSVCMGILLGGVGGFSVCFIGDLIGYMFNSMGYLYMAWVGLSTAVTAFISGGIFYGIKFNYKGWLYVKIAVISVLSFFVCTVGINSTGFYLYNYYMGFSQAVIDYVAQKFGTGVGYFGYLVYRLIFKGQIYNSLLNYALCFALVPLIKKIKIFSVNFAEEKIAEDIATPTREDNENNENAD